MFLNTQRPSLLPKAHIYESDSLIFDLEDAVAEQEKDSARFLLYHALTSIDYQSCEKVVRINGLDAPHYKKDIRVCVAAGADAIRIPKCETRDDAQLVAKLVDEAEKEYGRPEGSTLLMAAVETPRGVINALTVCEASERMMGIALGAGDYTRTIFCILPKLQRQFFVPSRRGRGSPRGYSLSQAVSDEQNRLNLASKGNPAYN